MKRTSTRAASALTVVVAIGALAGCQKPNPSVTIWSGTNSEHNEALCWSTDAAKGVDAKACATDAVKVAMSGGKVSSLEVVPGSTLGISVDPVVADFGWTPRIAGQPLTQTPIKSTYYRFTFPQAQFPAEGYALEIVAQGQQAGATRGVWAFKLEGPKN